MNLHIINPEVQRFIENYFTKDVATIALAKSPFSHVSSRELAEQLDGKQRSQRKLPLWFDTPGIIYPPKLAIEQSSSQATALYKSNLAIGNRLIDLTGGLGVDSFFFSKKVKEVTYCEQNTDLSKIAGHNLRLLSAENIEIVNHDSLLYLQATNNSFDTLYIDPSRRVSTKKVFILSDTEPNVLKYLPLFLSKASRIIIKTSPLFDIQSGLKELTNVKEVHVVSLNNDCKELLWVIDRGFGGEPEIICAAIKHGNEQVFKFTFNEELEYVSQGFSMPSNYVYEPDVALLKAGSFKIIAARFNILKLHPNTHLYTSSQPIEGFIGKVFRIISILDYKSFIKADFPKKANVISKNFPHSVEEIKKKHKISDGGNDYLIFSTATPNRLIVMHAVLS